MQKILLGITKEIKMDVTKDEKRFAITENKYEFLIFLKNGHKLL